MLETDPTKRPSAVDCLAHDFFIENDSSPMDFNPESSNISESLKNFQEKYKFNVKSIKTGKKEQVVNDSIEFRQPAINGKTDTVNDSVDFNSKGNIYSLHNVKAGAKGGPANAQKPETKRESIYKHALLQHATILQQENYETEDNSDSEDDGANPDGTPKKKGTKKSTLNPSNQVPENFDGKRKSQFGKN